MVTGKKRLTSMLATPGLALGLVWFGVGNAWGQESSSVSSPPPQAPVLMIHPAVKSSGLAENCEIDLRPSSTGNGYRLELKVPESVTEIDVTPTTRAGHQADFRISMDRIQRAAKVPQTESPPVQLNRPVAIETTLTDTQPAAENNGSGQLFQLNPFFYQATGGQPQLSSTGSAAATRQSSFIVPKVAPVALQEPSLDVRELVKLGQPEPDTIELTSAYNFTDEEVVEDDQTSPQLISNPETKLNIGIEAFGPATMNVGGTADFVVMLTNEQKEAVTDFELRLHVPEGLYVKVLDRPANYDKETSTITWSFPHLAEQATLAVRYRVEAVAAGEMTQALEVGNQGTFGQQARVSIEAQ